MNEINSKNIDNSNLNSIPANSGNQQQQENPLQMIANQALSSSTESQLSLANLRITVQTRPKEEKLALIEQNPSLYFAIPEYDQYELFTELSEETIKAILEMEQQKQIDALSQNPDLFFQDQALFKNTELYIALFKNNPKTFNAINQKLVDFIEKGNLLRFIDLRPQHISQIWDDLTEKKKQSICKGMHWENLTLPSFYPKKLEVEKPSLPSGQPSEELLNEETLQRVLELEKKDSESNLKSNANLRITVQTLPKEEKLALIEQNPSLYFAIPEYDQHELFAELSEETIEAILEMEQQKQIDALSQNPDLFFQDQALFRNTELYIALFKNNPKTFNAINQKLVDFIEKGNLLRFTNLRPQHISQIWDDLTEKKKQSICKGMHWENLTLPSFYPKKLEVEKPSLPSGQPSEELLNVVNLVEVNPIHILMIPEKERKDLYLLLKEETLQKVLELEKKDSESNLKSNLEQTPQKVNLELQNKIRDIYNKYLPMVEPQTFSSEAENSYLKNYVIDANQRTINLDEQIQNKGTPTKEEK